MHYSICVYVYMCMCVFMLYLSYIYVFSLKTIYDEHCNTKRQDNKRFLKQSKTTKWEKWFYFYIQSQIPLYFHPYYTKKMVLRIEQLQK